MRTSFNIPAPRLGRPAARGLRARIAALRTNTAGETIVEALVSMLIVSVAFVMLCTAIVSAANVNAKLDNQDTAFVVDASATPNAAQVTINHADPDADDANVAVDVYTSADENHYVYYTVNSDTGGN
ncbi:MAG: hypothetical protein Q4E12_02135 [Coriobacteriia bacterium]|nr:hypothetical protein [Coriobacteriia bacterium]